MPNEHGHRVGSDKTTTSEGLPSGKVFAHETISIDVLERNIRAQNVHHCPAWTKVHNVTDLQQAVIRAKCRESGSLIVTIPQGYSWGRLQITEDAFSEFMNIAHISRAFLDMILTYGVKTYEDERAFYGFKDCENPYSTSSLDLPNQSWHEHGLEEFCYNVPYMTRHERPLSDPWSLRQSAAYVQHGRRYDQYLCVIVNPRDSLAGHVLEALEENLDCCHLAFHLTFLGSLGRGWAGYNEYLSEQLQEHNNKAQYSNVDHAELSAYALSHHDLQDLYLLQTKIERAHHCIHACIGIGHHCRNRMVVNNNKDDTATITATPCPTTDNHPTTSTLLTSCFKHSKVMDAYITTMTNHAAHLSRLHARLLNIQHLVSSILVHRNSLLLQVSNQSSAKTLATLLEITVQSKAQQDILTSLLGTAQADSTLLKALSMVATVCLPAGLVAAVFSSNLVQSVPVDSSSSSSASFPDSDGASNKSAVTSTGKQQLVLSSQFWVYIAIAVPLMLMTTLWMLSLNRRAHQRAEKTIFARKDEKQRVEISLGTSKCT